MNSISNGTAETSLISKPLSLVAPKICKIWFPISSKKSRNFSWVIVLLHKYLPRIVCLITVESKGLRQVNEYYVDTFHAHLLSVFLNELFRA